MYLVAREDKKLVKNHEQVSRMEVFIKVGTLTNTT